MSLSRRKILALMGMSPAAGPLVAKMALDAEMANLAKVSIAGLQKPQGSTYSWGLKEVTLADNARALAMPLVRREIESLLYEQEQHVGRLDLDLATKRSFSLAAKVTFQRQRNVARRVELMTSEQSYKRVDDLIKSAIGRFFSSSQQATPVQPAEPYV